MSDMTPEGAIANAKACEPITAEASDANDPQGLAAGMAVTVSPDLDGGEQPVDGNVVSATADTITLSRNDDAIGTLSVHQNIQASGAKPDAYVD